MPRWPQSSSLDPQQHTRPSLRVGDTLTLVGDTLVGLTLHYRWFGFVNDDHFNFFHGWVL